MQLNNNNTKLGRSVVDWVVQLNNNNNSDNVKYNNNGSNHRNRKSTYEKWILNLSFLVFSVPVWGNADEETIRNPPWLDPRAIKSSLFLSLW